MDSCRECGKDGKVKTNQGCFCYECGGYCRECKQGYSNEQLWINPNNGTCVCDGCKDKGYMTKPVGAILSFK